VTITSIEPIHARHCKAWVSTGCLATSQVLPWTVLHLDISRNAIRTLEGLNALTNLQWLDASCNHIQVRRRPALCSQTDLHMSADWRTGSTG
jgi:hypothetical protein